VGSDIDSAAKRAKLKPGKNPYWHGVSGGRGGVSLGYRKPLRGPGAWVAKTVIDKARFEDRIGDADDEGCGGGALSYVDAVGRALDWAKRQQAVRASTDAPTVRSAVEAYIKKREQRGKRTGGNAKSRLTLYVLGGERRPGRRPSGDAAPAPGTKFSATKLAKLRASTIEDWRATLPANMKPASLNRLLADLRAALNDAVVKHRRELPGSTAIEIKVGTQAVPVDDEARHQLLTDKQVQAVVTAARAIDEDFGHLVLLAAATGARFSQIVRIKVRDVQRNRLRVLVPSSGKGRSGKRRPPSVVPLDDSTIRCLDPILRGRDADDVLLQRWRYRRAGGLRWEKDHRGPWGAADEILGLWAEAVKRAQAPDRIIMYALRHSSIVRGLTAGMPTIQVAKQHDTSVEMIEKHYAAYITDANEEIARRAAVSFAA
jgi:integrase